MNTTILHSTGIDRTLVSGLSLGWGGLAGAPVGFDNLAPRAQETHR